MSKEFLKVCAFQHKSPFSGMCSQSCTTLCDPVNYSLPGSSVHVIFQARIWSWLPFPTPRDLPNAGVEPVSLESPALAGRFFTTAPYGNHWSLPTQDAKGNCFHPSHSLSLVNTSVFYRTWMHSAWFGKRWRFCILSAP